MRTLNDEGMNESRKQNIQGPGTKNKVGGGKSCVENFDRLRATIPPFGARGISANLETKQIYKTRTEKERTKCSRKPFLDG